MKWRMVIILLCILCFAATCAQKQEPAASAPTVPTETQQPAPGAVTTQENVTTQPTATSETAQPDGKALVDKRCTVCHNTDRMDKAKHDKAGWEQTVDKMIKHGAEMSAAERATVVNYLASR